MNYLTKAGIQLLEGYTTGGPGTGKRVGEYIEKAGDSPGGFTKEKKKQVKRIFRKVVTKKTKSTKGETPSADKQRDRAKTFSDTLGHTARGGMGK